MSDNMNKKTYMASRARPVLHCLLFTQNSANKPSICKGCTFAVYSKPGISVLNCRPSFCRFHFQQITRIRVVSPPIIGCHSNNNKNCFETAIRLKNQIKSTNDLALCVHDIGMLHWVFAYVSQSLRTALLFAYTQTHTYFCIGAGMAHVATFPHSRHGGWGGVEGKDEPPLSDSAVDWRNISRVRHHCSPQSLYQFHSTLKKDL